MSAATALTLSTVMSMRMRRTAMGPLGPRRGVIIGSLVAGRARSRSTIELVGATFCVAVPAPRATVARKTMRLSLTTGGASGGTTLGLADFRQTNGQCLVAAAVL